MAYKRKTRDRWDVESNFGYGWDLEASYYSWPDCKRDLYDYKLYVHSYGGRLRVVKRREKIDNN